MIIRSLEVANFRKFRDPLRIEGFTDGLNIVVEPNETGKSTLLDALRAAFFIRYSAKTELVRSYVPIGDDVAPRVAVGFELRGQAWSLEKQFMKSPGVRLTGNGGRRESDAAEEALQDLLGFERGNNRGSDPETRGPLGMLWVEQASAFAVESPNRLVRDSVRGVLEAEIGAVTGGRRFDAIRAKVDAAYGELRTPATRKSRGALLVAEALVSTSSEARQRAETVLREYEQSLTELETAKARLRIVERDLVDPETAEERRQLLEDQKVAETVALRLSTAEAQHGRVEEVAKTAATRLKRLVSVQKRVEDANAALAEKQASRDAAHSEADAAGDEEKARRAALEEARAAREAADDDLSAARERAQTSSRAASALRAIGARNALAQLEKRERVLETDVAAAIDEVDLGDLATLERTEIEARARLEAGAVRVEIERTAGTELRVDGRATDVASVDVLSVTRFELGNAGSLTVTPPQGSGRSLDADLAAAHDEVATARRTLGIESHSAGIARNERAAAASRELKALRTQISAACPGDATIGLAPGADALRAFVAELGVEVAEQPAPTDDLAMLEEALAGVKLAEATAAGLHEEARAALSKAETNLATSVAELSSATREAQSASEELRVVRGEGDRATLEAALTEAQQDRAAKLEALETAREGSNAFNLPTIARRLQNIDRSALRCGQEQLELTARIAALESSVVREGTSGPAGRVAETREEEQAAIASCGRLRHEADVLEMLRGKLTDAANEASRTFLAPVTRRAAGYIGRLLPGCELTFDEHLGLTGVTRAGIDELCGDLSKGTQEQLAILTRLAFADLLLEDGAPISLILDDPLVYSDDARLEMMTDILQESSKRMQVILPTCRSKAFRHVDANRIVIG
jgi:DNA repair exonuclease SbcCD ATPase subunit